MKKELKPLGRPVRKDALREIKALQKQLGSGYQELSYRDKAALLQKRLGKRVDPKSVFRWEMYDLSSVA